VIRECQYTQFIMTFTYAREAVAAVWVFTLCTVGFAAGVTSISGWMAIAALALISVLILQRLWRHPAQTMSESIHQARR
jgi:hypothetical protein